MFSPKISVITIVYNDVTHLEGTILSVIGQSYSNIEYIIIDGNSSDGTVDLIQKYDPQISFWKSEPDKGIYDAMNKGLAVASGNYVLFLNSGDKLYHPNLFCEIVDRIDNVLPDVIYGETMIIAEDGTEIGLRRLRPPKELTGKSLKYGMLVCHQSFLAKRNLVPAYNLKYKLSADYDWMLNVLKKSTNILNSNQIIAGYLDGGVSKKQMRNSLIERFIIMAHSYGWFSTLFNHLTFAIRISSFYLRNRRI